MYITLILPTSIAKIRKTDKTNCWGGYGITGVYISGIIMENSSTMSSKLRYLCILKTKHFMTR